MTDTGLRLFEEARPRLFGLAYRILGCRAHAEDAVQDCFLKWRDADRSQVRTPAAWLSSVCTRRCPDLPRAAYLLHEIFDQSYAEIAVILEMDEAACRKLVSRARQNIDRDKVRHITPRETQDSMLRAFQAAVMSGSTTQLSALLSTDIRLTTDSAARLSPPLGFLKARTC